MENNEILSQEEKGISFGDLVFLIKKNLLMIFIITFLFTLAGSVYGLGFKKYTYTSTASAIVYVSSQSSDKDGGPSYQDILTAQYMINTFKDYVASISVAKDVIESDSCKEFNLDVKKVQENLTVTTQTSNSLVLTMKYKADSKEESITVLNQILDSTYYLSNQTELKDVFIIMDRAEEISTVGSRGAAMVIIICFVIGALLSCGIVLIKFLMDDTYTSKEDIEKHYNINVIASLPNIAEIDGGGNK